MKSDEERASAVGCDRYVTKPYSPDLVRITSEIGGMIHRAVASVIPGPIAPEEVRKTVDPLRAGPASRR
jgi:hypothetical protein